jgi:hypothetical protein
MHEQRGTTDANKKVECSLGRWIEKRKGSYKVGDAGTSGAYNFGSRFEEGAGSNRRSCSPPLRQHATAWR